MKKNGFSPLGLLLIMLLLGGGGLAAFKIGMPYMDVKVLRGIIDNALKEASNDANIGPNEIAKRVFDRANVQNIPIDYDEIIVKNAGNGTYVVSLTKVTTIPLWKDGKLVITLPVTSK